MNTPWAVSSSISICYYKTISLSPDAFPHADGVKRMTGLSLKMHNILPPASSQTPTYPTVNILIRETPLQTSWILFGLSTFCHIAMWAACIPIATMYADMRCKEFESTL